MVVPEVQHSSDDASLETGNNEDGGLLNCIDVLDNALTELSSLCEENAVAIADFKRKMIAIKDNSYKVVVQDYLSSSLELLDFFTDLEKFLDSARRSHSYFEHAIQQCSSLASKHGVGREEAKTILNILNNSIASNVNDLSGDELVERARCLLERQKQMLSKLIEQQKLAEDCGCTHFCRELMHNIFIGAQRLIHLGLAVIHFMIKFAAGICNCLAVDRGKADDQLNISFLEVCENEPNTNRTGDIKILIGELVNSIESLLDSSKNIANGGNVEVGIKNIKCYLKKFLDKIEVLGEKTGECSSKILKERQDVLK